MRFKLTLLFCLLGGLALLLGPSEALPQFGPPGGGGPPAGDRGFGGQVDPNQFFDRMSGGKDVWVRSEITDPQMLRRFDRAAQQMGITNGQITREQFVANLQQRMAQWGGGRFGGGPPSAAGSGGGPGQMPGASGDWVDGYFRRLDLNGDGFLNSDELNAVPELKADMARWDTNKDGKIDLNEFREYMKSRMAQWQGGGQWNGGGGEGDAADEEETVKRPVVYRGNNLPKELDAVPWFKLLDTDHDGQVALYEWKNSGRTIEEFEKYDRNGDGFITIEEVLAYEAAHRPPVAPGQQVASSGQPGGGWPGGPGQNWPGMGGQNWPGGGQNWQINFGGGGMRGNRGGPNGGPPGDNGGGNRERRRWNRGGTPNGDRPYAGNPNDRGQD
jgi:Ca2+-binding EF-hand superfamily protein